MIGEKHGEDVLLEYKTDCRICSWDVRDIWPWDAVDTEVKINHEDEGELIFTLFPPCIEQRKVVVWDKKRGELSATVNDYGCIDAIRLERRFFTLCIIEQPATPTILAVHQKDIRLGSGFCVYREVLDPQASREDAHFEAVEKSLYVVLNGKRFAEVTPDTEIKA